MSGTIAEPLQRTRANMRDAWRKAAIAGDTEALGRLLAEGLDIDGRDGYGQTAMMLAARHGRDDAVRLLLDKGADMNVTAKYGLSALMLAVVNRREGTARLLVDAGADTGMQGSGAPGFAGKTARDLADDAGLPDLAAHIAQRENE